ncbi:MAG: ParB N-terminal domain-containing protein [Pirellulaceae bacterium]|nr:ParB N-terminal domain-containing protein [Pirellulaceae bacterium]
MTTKTKKALDGGNRSEGNKLSNPNDTTIEVVSLSTIQPSPENDEIYGAINTGEHEINMLAIDIRKHGIREPIAVSTDGFIISGHRRYAAAKIVGLIGVPIRRLSIRRGDVDGIEWKRLLGSFNRQRIKSAAVRMRESMLSINPDVAYRQLITEREQRDVELCGIELKNRSARSSISRAKEPMLFAAIAAIEALKAFWPLTVRQVHYRLLNFPPLRHLSKPHSTYRNDRKSYQDLCNLLARARLVGSVPWSAIADETRPVTGTRYCADAAQFIDRQSNWFLRGYRRDLLQSQPDHIEMVAEKLTVQGIIAPIANQYTLPLTIGRGYCSLDPRRAIAERYEASGKDRLILLVASDLDPDGDSICESFARSIRDDFQIDEIHCIKALLTFGQVSQWQLSPNMMTAKKTSSQYPAYRRKYGSDAVYELEAVEPSRMQASLKETIESVLDIDAFNSELAEEKRDATKLSAIKASVSEHLASMDWGRDD